MYVTRPFPVSLSKKVIDGARGSMLSVELFHAADAVAGGFVAAKGARGSVEAPWSLVAGRWFSPEGEPFSITLGHYSSRLRVWYSAVG